MVKKSYKKTIAYTIDLGKGIAILLSIWLILVFFAFIVFSRASEHTYPILISSGLTVITLAIFLTYFKIINLRSWLFFCASLIVLVILFFIPINTNIPEDALELTNEISQQHDDRYEFAEELFFILVDRWTSPVRQYLLEPHTNFFRKDFTYFWEREGKYVDSNIQAQIYRHLLIESKRFVSDEVALKRTGCTNSPHTYVALTHPEGDVYADLWAAGFFEDYQFGMYTRIPCNSLEGRPLTD
ncbi:MAG: hypothetical protein ACMXYE_02925 [Candidatus Woesearchaeota archaeon]